MVEFFNLPRMTYHKINSKLFAISINDIGSTLVNKESISWKSLDTSM